MTHRHNKLALLRAGIDTYSQPVAYMREDCDLCRAEGFSAQTRVEITCGKNSIIATLNVVTDDNWLPPGSAGLSNAAWSALRPDIGEMGQFSHPEPPASASEIRSKVYGGRLSVKAFRAIISDLMAHQLSDLDLAAFITACAGDRLDDSETIALTRVMTEAGQRLDWGSGTVLDKHCVGGLPGNRTTPIVVAIIAAAGHRIPKTSSRAITSPAGTADTMEVMTPVALDLSTMRNVVESEGGCIAWGGGLNLSPADDMLIRIERPLDFDSEGQMVASILSKKAAAGSSHVLIDLPIGPTAKVRSDAAADALSMRLTNVAEPVGLTLGVLRSDGTAPVGRGIGPALEARDVLAVLRRQPDAPADLRQRALDIAAALLELAENNGSPLERATALLDSGAAETKFMAICSAQGGFSEPEMAPHTIVVPAQYSGVVTSIDNRRIAKIAKLAGAPGRKKAGVLMHTQVGDHVQSGSPLFEIHAETPGELAWALDYTNARENPMRLEAPK
jgi:thymidine phosphorylase